MKIGIYYFRSLFSQSACSLSCSKFSSALLCKGYHTNLGILKNEDYSSNREVFNQMLDEDIIIYKTNYKDFEYGIRLFENYKKCFPNKKIYISGAFALLNKDAILQKFPFIDKIINMQDKAEFDEVFPVIGECVNKDSVIAGVDRQIDILEKGSCINLESSAGCIYKCNFCHINLIGYPFYNVEIDALLDEIDGLTNKLHKKYLIFNDSIFYKGSRDTERIIDFCKKVKQRNLKFYFYIYLALQPTIPEELLIKLKEVGLIRVFVGVENITDDFQEHNPKAVSQTVSTAFLQMLKSNQISYHIGFMLFFPDAKYENLFTNLNYLHEVKKLFRLGIIIEKMRILPASKNSNILYETEDKIDQSYNYHFVDDKVEMCHNLVKQYFQNVNVRYFEQFFTGIDIAKTILLRENLTNEFVEKLKVYDELIEETNDKLHLVLTEIFTDLKVKTEQVEILLELYSKAEVNYTLFINKLSLTHNDIFKMLPHGKEELNIW